MNNAAANGKRTGAWARQLLAMSAKEFRHLARDTALMVFVVYAFTLDIYIQGSGLTFDLRHAPMVVHDADQSPTSRELVYRFQEPYFHLLGTIRAPAHGTELLDRGEAMVVLDIPTGFGATLYRGRPTQVQMLIDTSNSVLGLSASIFAEQIVARFGEEIAARRLAGATEVPRLHDDRRIWYNPNMTGCWFVSITELLQMITVLSIILPAAAMVREKERGTVEQLLVSPLTPFQIMFPKVLSMALVILLGTAFAIATVLLPIFHVPIQGSLTLFFALTALYIFTTAGIGLFAATVARNLAQAGMLTMLIAAPMIFLSGAFTPPEAMPAWLRAFVAISPLHYYIDATFGVLLKGAGLDLLWDEVLAIALLGGAIFVFGVWRFRRQFG